MAILPLQKKWSYLNKNGMKEHIICPKCHSDQISANQKGFNSSAGGLGMLTGGALTGMAYGNLGSGKIIITCLKCGNKFEPGSGAIKTIGEDGKENIVYQTKPKSNAKVVIIVSLLIFLVLFILFCYWVITPSH